LNTDSSDDQRISGRAAPRVVPTRGVVRVEILSIGADLLAGRVSDRNAQAIAERLSQRGAQVRRITTLPDDAAVLAQALREALERNPNLVLATGGLGPGGDDRTAAAVAETLGRPLSPHPEAKRQVEAAYEDRARAKLVPSGAINAAREKLFRLPVGCDVVSNPRGVAPGFVCRLPGGAAVIALPGRPEELRAMLEPALEAVRDIAPPMFTARREIESPTSDESSLRPLVDKLASEFPALTVSTRPSGSRKKGARIVITLEAVAPREEDAHAAVGQAQHRLLALAGGAL